MCHSLILRRYDIFFTLFLARRRDVSASRCLLVDVNGLKKVS